MPAHPGADRLDPPQSGRGQLGQLVTDPGAIDNADAMAVLARPSAAINSAFARNTCRCGAVCDLANKSSSLRCAADTSKTGTSLRMHRSHRSDHQLMKRHTTRSRTGLTCIGHRRPRRPHRSRSWTDLTRGTPLLRPPRPALRPAAWGWPPPARRRFPTAWPLSSPSG